MTDTDKTAAVELINEEQALEAYLTALLHDPDEPPQQPAASGPERGGQALADMSRMLAEIPSLDMDEQPSESHVESMPVSASSPESGPQSQPQESITAWREYAEPEAVRPALLPETLPIAPEPEPPVVIPEPVPEPEPLLPVEAAEPVAPIVDVAQPEIVASVAEVPEHGAPQPPTTGVPEWVQGPFQCLLFKVCGLKLAVPLTQLGGVFVWPETLTSLFGRPKWFLGIMPQDKGNIQVVDTSQLALPEKFHKQDINGFRYIILIGDKLWGLACDEVCEALTLAPDKVRWRTQRGSRPWLAGTVIHHMCALLDVEQLGKMLDAQVSS